MLLKQMQAKPCVRGAEKTGAGFAYCTNPVFEQCKYDLLKNFLYKKFKYSCTKS